MPVHGRSGAVLIQVRGDGALPGVDGAALLLDRLLRQLVVAGPVVAVVETADRANAGEWHAHRDEDEARHLHGEGLEDVHAVRAELATRWERSPEALVLIEFAATAPMLLLDVLSSQGTDWLRFTSPILESWGTPLPQID